MTHSLTLSPGMQVGPYTVVSPLRAGGMAVLYLAWRKGPAGFGRPVALKVVHTHLSRAPQFARMFVDEALLCARIRHPNVVHVEELGEHEGAYYLAMEYVDGASVEELLERLCAAGERLPVAMAVHIACALLEGLYAAHTLRGDEGEALGVVHRDVSPSNALVDRTGQVKLIDFGVAKVRGRAIETGAGTLKGKFAYMSPEQASGQPVDQRSDVYSLAVMLWEMLAMRPRFVADTELALLAMVRAPRIAPLSEIRSDVPPALDQVLSAALQRNPQQRHDNARELRRQLFDACPAARSVDGSELASLVLRLMGPPRPFDSLQHADLSDLGSTVSSGPHAPPPSSLVANSTGARADTAAQAPRARALLIALALAGLAAMVMWGRGHERVAMPTSSTPLRGASMVVPSPPPEAHPSLGRPLQPTAPPPARSLDPVVSTPREVRDPRRVGRVRSKKETTVAETVGPRSLGGVPIVANPPF